MTAASADDGDDDILHLVINEFPEHGGVEIDLAGTPDDTSDDRIIYTPYDYYNGEDDFSYFVVDVWGAQSLVNVDINIASVNQAPTAEED